MFQIDKYKMLLKNGVRTLNVIDKPGTGKSSIFRQITEDESWNYLPLYISNDDYTDIGGFPINVYNPKFKVKVLKKSIPEWAMIANEGPSLVVFEEWNRAPLENINAIFPIILERRIGYSFFFKPFVRFAMTGNLGGKEDGCDVNEFDRATKGRIITIRHNLTIEEWDKNFAEKKINIYIRNFIKSKNQYFYYIGANDNWNYASPRSWEALSEYIGKDNNDIKNVLEISNLIGYDIIGSTAYVFTKYLEESSRINIYDVINNYKNLSKENINRCKISDLLKELETVNTSEIDLKCIDNVIYFLKDIDKDERLSYLKFASDNLLKEDMNGEYILNKYLLRIGKTFKSDFEIVANVK